MTKREAFWGIGYAVNEVGGGSTPPPSTLHPSAASHSQSTTCGGPWSPWRGWLQMSPFPVNVDQAGEGEEEGRMEGWMEGGRDNDAPEERQAIAAGSLKLVLWLSSVRFLPGDARRSRRRSPGTRVTFRLPGAPT